jgi:hypothetical protein
VPKTGRGSELAGEKEGTNFQTTAASLKHRKYQSIEEAEAAGKAHFGENFQIVRDIATMPLAMARLERAIAGRELLNQIKSMGDRTGQNLVQIEKNEDTHFTINHPSFMTYRWDTRGVDIPEAHDEQLWNKLGALAEKMGVPHERMMQLKGGTRGAWGLAYSGGPKKGTVETKFAGPETVLTHELGHQLDFKYGLKEFMRGPGIAKELRALSDARYAGHDPDTVSEGFKTYVRKGTEKMANLLHAYVHAPKLLDELAPKAKAKFEEFLGQHPDIGEDIRDLKPSVTLASRTQGAEFKFPVRIPLYVHKAWEGPLKSILKPPTGGAVDSAYEGLMAVKTIAVESIMNSPLIHMQVVLGRALPVMPGRVLTGKAFVDGYRARNDKTMEFRDVKEFLRAGGAPISKFGNRQDITGAMTGPVTDPMAQKWSQAPITKAIGGLVSKVSPEAGKATAGALWKAADVWHNKLLWNRIGDLQMGMYMHARDTFLKQGLPPQAAQIVAAHMANRYVGSIPNEAMSYNARRIMNLTEFSRQFTMGNLGAMKDALNGMPVHLRAAIEDELGAGWAKTAAGLARRKTWGTLARDFALMYAGWATLQDYYKHKLNENAPEGIPGAVAGLAQGDTARAHAAMSGYERRAAALMEKLHTHPLQALNPFGRFQELLPTSENEPGKQDRILIGYNRDGSAQYYRFALGKVTEDMAGWLTHAHDMMAKKESTLVRPLLESITNNQGFKGSDKPVWDEKAVDENGIPLGIAKIAGQIAWHFMKAQTPVQQIQGAANLAEGKGKLSFDDMDAMKTIGPLFGFQFSKGFPGGPAVGEVQGYRKEHLGAVNEVSSDLREALHDGNMVEARRLMDQAHMTVAERRMFVRLSRNPGLSKGSLKQFMQTATPEEQERFNRMRSGQ